MTTLIYLILQVLKWGVIVNWIATYFDLTGFPEANNIKRKLDGFFKPAFQFIGEIIPNIRLGNTRVDFSPLILIFFIFLLQKFVIYIL